MGACTADPNAQVGGTSGTGGAGTGGDIVIMIPDPPNKGGHSGSVDGGAGKTTSEAGTQTLSSGADPQELAAKGCGCSIPGGNDGNRVLAGLLLVGALGLRRRRRLAA
jgi:MYXO-CTERM domain-containing protein